MFFLISHVNLLYCIDTSGACTSRMPNGDLGKATRHPVWQSPWNEETPTKDRSLLPALLLRLENPKKTTLHCKLIWDFRGRQSWFVRPCMWRGSRLKSSNPSDLSWPQERKSAPKPAWNQSCELPLVYPWSMIDCVWTKTCPLSPFQLSLLVSLQRRDSTPCELEWVYIYLLGTIYCWYMLALLDMKTIQPLVYPVFLNKTGKCSKT